MIQSSNLYLEIMEEDNRDVFREDQREQHRKTAYLEGKDAAIGVSVTVFSPIPEGMMVEKG